MKDNNIETRKIYFISFGCKVNQYETECMKQDFEAEGFRTTETESKADVFVINSCTVTETGDKKMKQTLRRLRSEYPCSLIVLSGCYPQAFKTEAEKLDEADIVTGTKNRRKVVELVKQRIESDARIISVDDFEKGDVFEKSLCHGFTSKTRAFVKIQDGCNRFCTYCIIPYSRGRIRSKPIEDIKTEIKELAGKGYKEIVLVGINLAFYGAEFGLRLADAVEVCCKTDGVERVRLGSLEPEVITDEDLDRLAKLPEFCPHFHLSLQSGCDKTLKAMNRAYTTEEYSKLMERIRSRFENCSFTTDIMVGFPDETEEDFVKSMEFVKKAGFAKVHIFPYSRREGTPASRMKNQITKAEKHSRVKRMEQVSEEIRHNFLESQVGKEVPVLFERETTPEFHQGHSPNYTLIKIPSKSDKKSLRKQIFCVKIKSAGNDCCFGEISGTLP